MYCVKCKQEKDCGRLLDKSVFVCDDCLEIYFGCIEAVTAKRTAARSTPDIEIDDTEFITECESAIRSPRWVEKDGKEYKLLTERGLVYYWLEDEGWILSWSPEESWREKGHLRACFWEHHLRKVLEARGTGINLDTTTPYRETLLSALRGGEMRERQ